MATFWKPLTCPCELEIDGERWINTIKKCNLHKDYSGQKLLNAVKRHNIQNSPAVEQGVIEFHGQVTFEPDWIKQVAKYPSLEKISEAKFNLESMHNYDPMDKEFQYTLSNFLSSSRSIFWYLLEEYNAKFSINIETYFKNEQYRDKHKKLLSPEGQRFVLWYEAKFEEFKKHKSSFLIEKRDFNIHSGYVKQIFLIKFGGREIQDEIKNGHEIPMDFNSATAFFPEDENSTVIELCKDYIKNIEKLVIDCHNEFPIR